MNIQCIFIALCLFASAMPAMAEGGGTAYEVMVVDRDAQGTNMRDAPAGKVVRVIPFKGRADVRLVSVREHSKGWFNVMFDGNSGWMHGSILGTCAAATEDGDPALSREPRNDSPATEKIPAGAPVTLLDMRDGWLKVRYTDRGGKRHDGWLPQQALLLSEDMQQECAGTWAKN